MTTPPSASSALALGLFCALGACKPSRVSKSLTPSEPNSPPQRMSGLTATNYLGNTKTWILQSPRADVLDNPQALVLSQPHMKFFKGGELSSRLVAQKGWLDTVHQDMRAEDDVVVTSTDGARLDADWLLLDNQAQVIRSTAPVRIIRNDSTTWGNNLVSTLDLSSMTLTGETTKIPPKNERTR